MWLNFQAFGLNQYQLILRNLKLKILLLQLNFKKMLIAYKVNNNNYLVSSFTNTAKQKHPMIFVKGLYV